MFYMGSHCFVLKHFSTFTAEHLCWSLLCRHSMSLKKTPTHMCFPVNIAKIFRTPSLKNICKELFLLLVTDVPKHSERN